MQDHFKYLRFKNLMVERTFDLDNVPSLNFLVKELKTCFLGNLIPFSLGEIIPGGRRGLQKLNSQLFFST
jgi:hypothetical protein